MTYVRTISEVTPVARKRHRCDECNRIIYPGVKYLRQLNCDDSDKWTFKAHEDCSALGVAIRDKNWLWSDEWMPLHEITEDGEYLTELRGLYPHAVTRLEFGIEEGK